MTNKEVIKWYGEQLLAWYFKIERDLPWRKNHDPYRIWVSEIMLQQTQVKTVIPYFERFMSHFPTVSALAHAPEEEVLKCWEGLGYYSRARNLQAGAKMVVEKYNGTIPNNVEQVSAIKGVGPYTTGAIMSIAFNEPIPAVDGNVMRVLSRFFCLEDDVAKASTRKKIESLVTSMIPTNQARFFNQALMELGALVCIPKSPRCIECPVALNCEAHRQGREKELPIKTKAKAARVEQRIALLITKDTEQGKAVFITQRPTEGLLASMWEIPHIEINSKQINEEAQSTDHQQESCMTSLLKHIDEKHHLLARPVGFISNMEHIFSHIHWKMSIYEADLGEVESVDVQTTKVAETTAEYIRNNSQPLEALQGIFITKDEMNKYPFPNLFLRVIEQYFNGRND